MTRIRAMNTSPAPAAPIRSRARPATNGGPTTDMIAKAREAFLKNKEANAATSAAGKAVKELAKLMAQGDVTEFEFTASTPTGASVPARAAIEETVSDEISVEKLRLLVDEATFMRIVKAAKGAVEAECGEHIAIKATATVTKPAALKVKEAK